MMAKKARDVMTADCQCIGENDSVLDAGKRLAELDVGACRSAARITGSKGC
jgi:hypothetical protein